MDSMQDEAGLGYRSNGMGMAFSPNFLGISEGKGKK
jgi:hypothetical protein